MKIGVLGGGQLGRMFLQAAYNYPFEYHIMDSTASAPCSYMTNNFVQGDLSDYAAVMAFGQDIDVIGIEIEHVNIQALKDLQDKGKTVIPSPNVLEIIQDKGLQKQFYQHHNIPSPDYYLINNITEVDVNKIPLPFVQKCRTGGYDGKGVQVIYCQDDLAMMWDVPSVIEVFTPIAKEIAVMVVKGKNNELVTYPCVEMVFDTELNLVDYLFAPAHLNVSQQQQAIAMATQVANNFNSTGIFAIELFIDNKGEIWVNETAPRVHNSGHHTIEAAYSSQFDQMCRVLAGLPLGNADLQQSGAMINLIGAAGHEGKAVIEGLQQLTAMDKVYLHWYGKENTSPGRKMGHISILGDDKELTEKIKLIKQNVRVISEAG